MRTHCPHCSVNCGLEIETNMNDEVVGQRRWRGAPSTRGELCPVGAKAAAGIRHPGRLLTPLVRNLDGRLVEASWAEALDRASDGFETTRQRWGADANAVLAEPSITNEKAYVVGKLARVALRTRHLDLLGHPDAGRGIAGSIGLEGPTVPVEEVVRAGLVVVVGLDLTDSHPVLIPDAVAKARRRGAEIVVIGGGPAGTGPGPWVRQGDLRITTRADRENLVLVGLLAELQRQGDLDQRFLDRSTVGSESALAAAGAWTVERVAEQTGADPEALRLTARLLASTRRAVILFRSDLGPAAVNLALGCGLVERPGSGILPLAEGRNRLGARIWGLGPDLLPGGRSLSDPYHRSVLSRRWGFDGGRIPPPGASAPEIIEAAEAGTIRSLLWFEGDPGPQHREAGAVARRPGPLPPEGMDHLVVIGPYTNPDLHQRASVVLPGVVFAEEEGTVLTVEGRTARCDQALPPVARYGEFDIIRNLARRLGVRQHFDHVRGREVFEEMRRVSCGGPMDLFGVTWSRARDGVRGPCPTEEHPGTARLHPGDFPQPDGKARFLPVDVASGPDPAVLSGQGSGTPSAASTMS